MSTMFTPAPPSASAISAITPGRLGTDDPQLARRSPPVEPGPEQRVAVGAGALVPGASPRPRRRLRAAARTSDRRRRTRRSPRSARRGWTCRCRSRSRCWRPPRAWRRGSSGRPPAGARWPTSACSPPSTLAACATSRLASTCGRCETAGHQAIVRVGVDRRRLRAEARSAGGAGARRARRRCAAAGVRYQVAPSNRSSRACCTPAVSAPASGWPPIEALVGAAPASDALGRADVADHAVRAGAGERSADGLGERADRASRRTRRRRRATALGDVGGLRVDRAERQRPRAHAPVGVIAAHLARRRGAARPGRSSRRSARPRGPRPSTSRPRPFRRR